MSRILLADDSPHAQRMGERILREEGYEVVSVTDGSAALRQLDDVDPDLIVADVFLPGQSGLDICRAVKADPKHRHMKVVVTAGLLETFDEEQAKSCGADAIIRKPFEATAMIEAVKPLLAVAQIARGTSTPDAVATAANAPAQPKLRRASPLAASETSAPTAGGEAIPATPVPALHTQEKIDAERVRAAVTVALDAAMPALIEELSKTVMLALKKNGR